MSKFHALVLEDTGTFHGRQLPIFLKNLLPPSSGQIHNVITYKATVCRIYFVFEFLFPYELECVTVLLDLLFVCRSACPHVTTRQTLNTFYCIL